MAWLVFASEVHGDSIMCEAWIINQKWLLFEYFELFLDPREISFFINSVWKPLFVPLTAPTIMLDISKNIDCDFLLFRIRLMMIIIFKWWYPHEKILIIRFYLYHSHVITRSEKISTTKIRDNYKNKYFYTDTEIPLMD